MNLVSLSENRILRFLVTGSVNTALTYVIYLLLKPVLGYQPAYFVSYVCGILFTYVVSSLFVFKSPMSLITFLRFPLVYVAQYVFGALMLGFLVNMLGISDNLAPLCVIVLTLPLTYLLSRLVFSKK